MKFSKSELADLFKASYNHKLFDVQRFHINKKLSDELVKVYTLNDSMDVVVVHRGSNDMNDWVDNGLHLADLDLTLTKTYKMHLRRQLKAVKKYGKDNIICLGYNRGGF